MDEFDDIGPCVVMARYFFLKKLKFYFIIKITILIQLSPGMMQSGLSRELFESWCSDKKSGVIIAVKIKNNIFKIKI